jgi:hypothetical protein
MASSIYEVAQKRKWRITLEVNALGDFDPHQIDWNKNLMLEHNETCDAYVEDLDSTIW